MSSSVLGGKRGTVAAVGLSVTAALLGDPLRHDSGRLGPDEWERRYEDRPKVDLSVREDMTLGETIDLAVASFAQRFPEGTFEDTGTFYAFHSEFDDDGMASGWGRISRTVNLVDEQGRALWNRPAASTTYQDLLIAADGDSLLGDPVRPYVVLCPEIGNGFYGSWQDVVNAWLVFWRLVETASQVSGALSLPLVLVTLLGHRVRRSPEVIQAHAAEWDRRHATPPDVGALIDQKPRNTKTLARLLGLSVEETEILLESRGYEMKSGLWVPGEGAAQQILRRVAEYAEWVGPVEEVESQARLRRAIEGQSPWE